MIIPVIFLFVFSGNIVFSQETGFNYTVKGQYGLIANHHPLIRYIARDRIKAGEFCISKQLTGKKDWHIIHRFPEIGVGTYFADLGDPDLMGKAYALYGFLIKPIYRKEFFSFNYQVSAGASWLNAPFDAETNYFNGAIGSNVNVYFNLAYDVKFRLSDKIKLFGGIGFTHYSNGAWTKPNLGFNVITGTAGVTYNFKNNNPLLEKRNIEQPEKLLKYELYYAVAFNEFRELDKGKYFVSSFCGDVLKKINRKNLIGIGIDQFYIESNDGYYKGNGEPDKSDRYRTGLHFTYEIEFNRILFFANIGFYVIDNKLYNGRIYDRVGIKGYMYKNLFGVVALHTHYASADFIEWGLGWTFCGKTNK
ncbi:MAG: hypothetical protein A2W91_15225 [Bacteroidetes bacterium GWF2_38_335]|nr:MAG: hypothetical protein A2W91_15225 [Bacteroidetes bacterium GWF2_38_335]OFY81070.1 MAG: hypothetical protein A2281_13255 [Bacteroidetes bacterium RIFOXYA12_FULL_38_20]HBS87613.1 hypothetical protein [Bacteroidales bacterium]